LDEKQDVNCGKGYHTSRDHPSNVGSGRGKEIKNTRNPILDDIDEEDVTFIVVWHGNTEKGKRRVFHMQKFNSRGEAYEYYNHTAKGRTNNARIILDTNDIIIDSYDSIGFPKDNLINFLKRRCLVNTFLQLAKDKGIHFTKKDGTQWWYSPCRQLVVEDYNDGKLTAILSTNLNNRLGSNINEILCWTQPFKHLTNRFQFDMVGKSISDLENILDILIQYNR
jgi:hypothetical protein